MDGPEPQDEQGLRAATRNWRDAPLRGNEPPDGQKIGSFMRLFRQFLIPNPVDHYLKSFLFLPTPYLPQGSGGILHPDSVLLPLARCDYLSGLVELRVGGT